MTNERQSGAGPLIVNRAAAFCLLLGGLVAPCAALILASNAASQIWPALIAPFGMFRLLVVHAIAACPLVWMAWPIVGFGRAGGMVAVTTAVFAGCAGALLTVMYGVQVGSWTYEFGFLAKLACRCLWVTILVAPWIIAARSLLLAGKPNDRPSPVSFALSLLIAVFLPAVYAEHARDTLAAAADAYQAVGRTWKAWQIVNQLALSGGNEAIRGQHVHNSFGQLAQQIRIHSDQLTTPLGDQATEDRRMQYASHLLALEQLAEARAALEPVAAESPRATLMIAEILDIQQRVAASIEMAERTIEMLKDQGEGSVDRNLLRVRAYTRLSAYLRKAQRYADAEQVLLEGLARWKENEGDFHYYLAQHYSLGGRPQMALRHYQAAADASEHLAQFAEPAIKELSLRTPACLFRRPRLVTR